MRCYSRVTCDAPLFLARADEKRVGLEGKMCHILGMDDISRSLIEYKSLVIGFWLVALLVGERLAPAVVRLGGWGRVMRNAGLWGLNIGLSLLIIVPLSAWAAGSALDWRPDWLAGWGGLAFDIIFLDFMIYWWHRANHVLGPLWRFHEVHHLDRFLDVSSSVRFHFGEVLLSAGFRVLIILALGIPIVSVLIFEALVLAAAAFQHSNLKLVPVLERVISWIFITPSIHWIHHHAKRADTDSNYGTIFSFWDPIFGSRSRTRRTPDLEIGVEAIRRDGSFANLLIRPFQIRRDTNPD